MHPERFDHACRCTITVTTPKLPTLLKSRDIARAHEQKEGSIAILAKRFHASTSTVSRAIRRPAAAWQADIDAAKHGETRSWEYAAATLEPIHGDPADRIVAYALQLEGQAAMIRVDGPSIVPAANVLGTDGWEIVHVTTEGSRVRFLLKRIVVTGRSAARDVFNPA